jgi:hypothetical protein
VWFQNAVRVACGLAVARLVAGSLDLTHGFWVLLAVLTLGRTTAGATWSEPPVGREGVQADWHAVVIVAYHMVMGAQRLPRFEVPPSRVPPDALARIRTMAAGLEREADRIAARFIDLDRPALPDPDRPDPGRRPAPPRRESTGRPPPEQRPALPAVVDLEVWLTAVGRQLTRIEGSVGAPEPAGS